MEFSLFPNLVGDIIMTEKKLLNLYMALGGKIGERIFYSVLRNSLVCVRKVFWDRSSEYKKIRERCKKRKIIFKLMKSSPTSISQLETPYLFICAGFGYIIKKDLLDSFNGRAYNIHPSLLPSYRGRHAIQWSIACGENILGCTVHRLCSQIDTGDIIYQKKIKISIEENLQDISQRLFSLGRELCKRLINDYYYGAIPKGRKQQESLYWRRRKPHDGGINWKDSAFKIINTVRAVNSSYPAFTKKKKGSRVIISKCVVSSTPGLVLRAYPKEKEYIVATSDGIVMIQTESRLKVGDRLI